MTTHRKSKQPIEQLKQYEQSPKQPQRQPKKLEQLREQLEQPKKSEQSKQQREQLIQIEQQQEQLIQTEQQKEQPTQTEQQGEQPEHPTTELNHTNMIEINKIIDTKCSQLTNEMRVRHLKTLNRILTGGNVSDLFNYGVLFDFDLTIKKIEDMFEAPSSYGLRVSNALSYETRSSYLSTLCKVLHYIPTFPSELYVKYDRYYRNVSKLSKQNSVQVDPQPDEFLETQKKLQNVFFMKKQGNMKKIISLLAMIDINKNEYGVIRIDDFVNTTISSMLSSNNSYLNLDTCEWHILSQCTKNKIERTFSVPKEWVNLIKEVDKESIIRPGLWLLYDRDQKKYENSDSLCKTFKKLVGMNYYDIKHQFVTYLHNHSTTEQIQRVAHNMGHSLNVAVSTYNDTHF